MNVLSAIKAHRLIAGIMICLLLILAGTISSRVLIERGAEGLDEPAQRQESNVQTPVPDKEVPHEGSPEARTDSAKAYGGLTPVADLPPFQDRIIKTGSMTLNVKKGKFYSIFDQVVLLAKANGGYVAGSNSLSTNDRLASGTLTIKVPAKNFEGVLAKLRRFGKMTALNISSRDVSPEFVDLESRLRNQRAQEAVLLTLMNKAETVGDSISVQQQLSQVQMEIEQIMGRLNVLKDQTSFSSIQVTVAEPGISPNPIDPWGFKSAVQQAAHAFVGTINGLVVLVGYLSPFALLAGLAGLIWSAVRRRTTTAAT